MRAVTRDTRDTIFDRGVRIMRVEIREGVVWCWPKGTRQKQPISVAAAWQAAVKAEVDKGRREKKKKGRK